jgi:hypothetical protein
MLRRSVCALGAVFFAVPIFPAPALAQGADLTRVTCQQFNALPMPDRRQLGLWLHGYYTGAAQRPFLDMARVDGAISAMIAGCQEHPDRPLLGQETGAALREIAPVAPVPDSRIIIEDFRPPEQAPEQRPRPRPAD